MLTNNRFMPSKQVNTEQQEQDLLKQLNPRLMADYLLVKEKGDDIRVYSDEQAYVQHRDINQHGQLVLGKNMKVPIVQR
jgi:hypothetical protein